MAIRLRDNCLDLLRRGQIDRPVFFGLLARIWSLISGPVIVLLIASVFSPELQGYYYTFSSLLALQTFVEMGLGTVIVQFASHEWSNLSLDGTGKIVGDEESLSRLMSLTKIALRWYTIGSLLLVIGLSISGYFFFSGSHDQSINWAAPWFLLCVLTGATLCLVPIWSLLEGCNQVSSLYTFRFWEGCIVGISTWGLILLGAGLWTPVLASVVTLACAAVFIRSKCLNFFKSIIYNNSDGPHLSWSRDIFPMQWRISLSWMAGYFIFCLFTPVLFKYHGPVVAGQMGMTWNAISVITSIAGAWLAPRVPTFGILIAQKKYDELDDLFWRVTRIIIGITTGLSVMLWGLIYVLNLFEVSIAKRVLPPLPAGIFIIAQCMVAVSIPFSAYLRAHRQEPLVKLSVLGAFLIGTSTYVLGKYFSSIGMAVGYLGLNIILIPCVFLIWRACKQKWHSEPAIHGEL